MQTSDDMPLNKFMPELNYADEEEVKKAYEGKAAQPGVATYKKGMQTFFIPYCSHCLDYTKVEGVKQKMYGDKNTAHALSVKHILEKHAAAQ